MSTAIVTRVLAADIGGTLLKGAVVLITPTAGAPDITFLAEQRWPMPWSELNDKDAAGQLIAWVFERLDSLDDGSSQAISLAIRGLPRPDRSVRWDYHINCTLRWPSQHRGLPLTLANDAQAAAEAEYRAGTLRGVAVGALITVGTGIGAGLVVADTVIPSMTGAAMVTEEFPGSEGDFGACCGSTGIERAAAQHGLAGLAAPQIIKLWKQDHPQAAQAITDLADYFATGAADLADSLIAERIAVGGGLAVDLGEAFLELVRPRLSSHLNFECELVSAHWGARAGVVGAALLATEGTGPSGRNEEVLPPTLASGLAEVQSSTDEASEWGEERHLQAVYGMKTRL